jgi:hypothetical protein
MTTVKITLTILTSSVVTSVVTAFLTAYFQKRLQKSDYKLKYFEKVTDRRLDAYELANQITSFLKVMTAEDNSPWPVIMGSIDFYNDFMAKLAMTTLHNIWFSDMLSDKLTELNVYLKNIETEYQFKTDEEIQNAGKKCLPKLRLLSKEIRHIIDKDYKSLNDIDSFNKKSRNNFPVR